MSAAEEEIYTDSDEKSNEDDESDDDNLRPESDEDDNDEDDSDDDESSSESSGEVAIPTMKPGDPFPGSTQRVKPPPLSRGAGGKAPASAFKPAPSLGAIKKTTNLPATTTTTTTTVSKAPAKAASRLNIVPKTESLPQPEKAIPKSQGQLQQLSGLKSAAPKTNINEIIAKMKGVTVTGVSAATPNVAADLKDMLQKESDETIDDFEYRKVLTEKISTIPNVSLNNVTCVTLGLMIMKKAKLQVNYDSDIESVITYILEMLRQ